MTPLSTTSIQIATSKGGLNARQLLDTAQQLFPADALCLYQGTHRAVLAPLREMDLEADWLACTSCVICSDTVELRAEKAAFEDRAACRLVAEGEALPGLEHFAGEKKTTPSETFVRTSRYMLHGPVDSRHAGIQYDPAWGNRPKLTYKEYFSPDNNGWLQLQAGCFAGIAKGGNI